MKHIFPVVLLLLMAACGGGKTAKEKEREEKYEAIKAEASVFEKDWLALGDMVKGLGAEITQTDTNTRNAVSLLENEAKKKPEILPVLNDCKKCNETLTGLKSTYTTRIADWNKTETEFNTWTGTFSQGVQNLDSATKVLKGFKSTMESFQNDYTNWKKTLDECSNNCIRKFEIHKK